MEHSVLQQLADLMYEARLSGKPTERVVPNYPGFSMEDAYAVMQLNLARREREGAVRVGYKIGATNAAIMAAMGVEEPLWTRLYRDMLIENGGRAEGLIAPKIEPEIAFLIGSDLDSDTPDITMTDVMVATAGLLPAIEVADCRIKDWNTKACDSVTDSAHAAGYVLGDRLTPISGLALCTLGCVVEKNGALLFTAAAAAVLGNPVNAVCWLANTLIKSGDHLRKGDVVLSGSLTSAAPGVPGDAFRVVFAELGSVCVGIG